MTKLGKRLDGAATPPPSGQEVTAPVSPLSASKSLIPSRCRDGHTNTLGIGTSTEYLASYTALLDPMQAPSIGFLQISYEALIER